MNSIKICIDAGHGGYDPGAVGPGGTKEKDVTLVISLLLAEKLRVAGQEVILTREGDVVKWTPSNDLTKRCQIANNNKADVFISIHANAATNPAATGTETYHHVSSIAGKKLAKAVQENLIIAFGLPDRGIKTANFTVLTGTNMPAILVELAFISNQAEEAMLRSAGYQEQAAEAIYRGLARIYGLEVSTTVSTGTELWKETLIDNALQVGLITERHNPDEQADKWFVLAVALSLLKKTGVGN